ncbi:MAG: signal peptidase I [Bacteroidales bacterium]|nr:signal peptidase I [Bacteroidales bacterium]
MKNDKSDNIFLKEVSLSLLAEGKSLRIKPAGYSMFPAIRPGNIVIITPVINRSKLTPGDIVVFRRDSDFVLHRLTDIRYQEENAFYITRGDSSINEDKPITVDKIFGVVTTIETKRGKIKPHYHKVYYYRNRLMVRFIHLCNKLLRVIRLNSRNSY